MSQGYGSNPNDPNQPPAGGYPQGADQSGYQPPASGGYQPPVSGYQPPAGGGYQPPPAGGPPPGGQPGYSAPSFNQADMSKMMQQGRADLGTLPSKWMKVLASPSPQTFASELPNANPVAIVTNVLVAAVVSGLIYFLLYLVLYGFGFFGYGIGAFFNIIITVIVQFAIGIGLAYVFSTYLFGGKGDPMQLAWAVSLYGVPLIVARYLLTIIVARLGIGFLFGLVTLLFWLAVFYYLWMALQAVFKLNSQNAMYAALSTVALPLLGSLLLLFNIGFLPAFFYGLSF